MTSGRTVEAIDTPTLLACAGIPASTLNYWIEKKLCAPHVEKGSGKRATRYWTVQDLVVVKAVRALRDAGCPLSTVAPVQRPLAEHWNRGLSDAVLYYDGQTVIVVDDLQQAAVTIS